MADNDKNDQKDEKPQESSAAMRWLFIGGGAVVVLFIIVVLAIIIVPTRHVYTDDAYVTAHYTVVGPRISGQVIAVCLPSGSMGRNW